MGAQGDDNKALKQAFYNTAAILFVVFAGCAAVSVFYILEAFLRPLLWAVLCGTFLHPFKSTLTGLLRGWLRHLRVSRTPLAVGTILVPFKIVDNFTEKLSGFFITHVRLVLGGAVTLFLLNMMYYFGPLQQILDCLRALFVFLYEALGYFNAVWVWSVVLAYGLIVLLFWSPQSSVILKPLSIPVWLAVIFHLATVAGPLRVPLLLLVIILIIVGFVSEVSEVQKKEVAGKDVSSPSALLSAWSSPQSASRSIDVEGRQQKPAEAPSTGSDTASHSEEKVHIEKEAIKRQRPNSLNVTSESADRAPDGSDSSPTAPTTQRTLVDKCFIALIWALILVRIWIHIWVINLLPILCLCLIIKKFGTSLGSWKGLQDYLSRLMDRIKTNITNDARLDILIPRPIHGLGKLMLRGDSKIIKSLETSLDQTVTVLMVLLLLVGTVVGTLFIIVQVHKESMHIVTLTSNVLNKTMQPEYMQWLPNQDEMKSTIDSMVANAYHYGREWIADKLHGAINGDDAKKSQIEKQVLDVWDRLYEKLSSRNNTAQPEHHLLSRQVSLDLTNMTSVWEVLTFSQNFDLVDLAKENIGVFMQVIDSVWAVLKGNISLVLNVLTATLSLLFGGGTALLNFFLSMMVFLTTLFYLLSSSGEHYKPIEWFSSLNPTQGQQGNKFGKAVEQAISSVFLASLKMAAFYGLYTWLTHTVFGIQIVFIPSALAAIFAAVPFLGTYFAAVPAIIELWLVNGEKLQALLLFICHLLPMFFVDTAIYSEVKGGHPYLTGLAIVGGIYWLGLEGAIIGPILLCCLVVAMNMYSTMLQPDTISLAELTSQRRKKAAFSMKRGFSNIS